MSVSSLSTTSDLRSPSISSEMRTSGVNARRTRQHDTDASGLAVAGQQQPFSFRDALEQKLSAAVDAGTLSQDDAAVIRQAMNELDQQIKAEGNHDAKGRRGPDPSEMFSALDANGDGSLTEEEFVAGRPNDVTEEQAQAFYNTLAGDTPSGLSQEQFAKALAQAGGPGGHPDGQQGGPAGPTAGVAAANGREGGQSEAGGSAGGEAGGSVGGEAGGSAGGGSADKTEVSRTTTTVGTQTVTVITYSDGSTETTTEPASSASATATISGALSGGTAASSSDSVASRLMALLQTLGGGESGAMAFMKTALTGRMLDVRA